MSDNRVIRLVHIVLDLASGRARTVDDLALDCGVSRRTLQRDLRILRDHRIEVWFEDGQLALSPGSLEEVRRWMGAEIGFAVR